MTVQTAPDHNSAPKFLFVELQSSIQEKLPEVEERMIIFEQQNLTHIGTPPYARNSCCSPWPFLSPGKEKEADGTVDHIWALAGGKGEATLNIGAASPAPCSCCVHLGKIRSSVGIPCSWA